MNTLTNKKINIFLEVLLFILIILWTGFIFDMSTKTAEESSAISGGLLRMLLSYIKDLLWFDVEFSVLHNIFRKFAHFTEYFILGFLSVSFFTAVKSRPVFSLLHCLATSVIDENLQRITGAGRSMQISDMVTDFCGSISAIIIFYIISFVIFKIKEKRIKN